MFNLYRLFFCLLIILFEYSYACVVHNDVKFRQRVSSRFQTTEYDQELGIGKEEYEEVISNITDIYREEIERDGIKLEVTSNWHDEEINAFSDQISNTWSVNFPGGYARMSGMTKDTFALVVCHEFGHHLGGAPYLKGNLKWASAEGQSDYWASSICFPQVYSKENSVALISEKNVEDTKENVCHEKFKNKNDAALCVRQLRAALNLHLVGFNTEVQVGVPPSLSRKDLSIVLKTDPFYPNFQCRLDTAVEAALCNEFKMKRKCTRTLKNNYGLKPLCWYRPKMEEGLLIL